MLEAYTQKANTHMHIWVKENWKKKHMNALYFSNKIQYNIYAINFMEIFPVLPLLESLNFKQMSLLIENLWNPPFSPTMANPDGHNEAKIGVQSPWGLTGLSLKTFPLWVSIVITDLKNMHCSPKGKFSQHS